MFLKVTSEMVRLLYRNEKLKISSAHVTSHDIMILNGMTYGVLITKSKILLSIALSNLNSIVDVINVHRVVGNVLHAA